MDVQTRIGMPMDEFIRQYEQQPFELINGERIERMPPVAIHGEIVRLLIALLTRTTAFITYTDMPFVLEDTRNWVKGSLVPDVMMYEANRLSEYKKSNLDWGGKPFVLVPDVCIEVISQTDNYSDLDDKVLVYLSYGVRLVWVINPRNQTIKVYTNGSNQITQLTVNDTLTGGDVLPGFSTPVSAIFPQELRANT